MATPTFSPGSDEASLSASVTSLTAPHGFWSLSADGMGLERTLTFKTFKAAWAFMDATAAQCKTHKHHPEWSNVYATVFMRWTTHNPRGLGAKDVTMAAICDDLAVEHGVLKLDNNDTQAGLRQTVGRVTEDAGDCCGPSPEAKQAERQREKEKIEAEEGATGAEGSVKGMGGQPS